MTHKVANTTEIRKLDSIFGSISPILGNRLLLSRLASRVNYEDSVQTVACTMILTRDGFDDQRNYDTYIQRLLTEREGRESYFDIILRRLCLLEMQRCQGEYSRREWK